MDIYDFKINDKNASIGMFKGLCDYIRERGGLTKISPQTMSLYERMRKNLLNIHKVNAYYQENEEIKPNIT